MLQYCVCVILCMCHSYVPENFMSINIVPLVKNKCGDLTDVNNYRAIALCNIDTKVLEKIVLAEVTSYHACDDHQFGFKKDHSTALCKIGRASCRERV